MALPVLGRMFTQRGRPPGGGGELRGRGGEGRDGMEGSELRELSPTQVQ